MTNTSLVPVEQKYVEFYDDTLVAVQLNDGSIFIPVKPICDLLGIDWAGQYRRIQRDEVLSDEIRPIDVTSTRRGTQAMVCLPLHLIGGFLFGLNPSRVKPELKDRVIRYRRECHKVLAEAFQSGRLTADISFDQLTQSDTPAAQAYRMASAIMKMAEQQMLLEARIDTHSDALAQHDMRIEQLEATLGNPDRLVTPEQAVQISQAVKAIAMEMGKRSGRNEYGGVYGELYRRMEVTSYKRLPASRFEEAMSFLRQWWQTLTDQNNVPF